MAELQRQEITARIREARLEAGLTQTEMADALDITMRTYQNYEDSRDNGNGRVPWSMLGKIAEVTAKSKQWLLHGDTPDLMGSPTNGGRQQLERIENKLDALLTHLKIPDPNAAEIARAMEEAANLMPAPEHGTHARTRPARANRRASR